MHQPCTPTPSTGYTLVTSAGCPLRFTVLFINILLIWSSGTVLELSRIRGGRREKGCCKSSTDQDDDEVIRFGRVLSQSSFFWIEKSICMRTAMPNSRKDGEQAVLSDANRSQLFI